MDGHFDLPASAVEGHCLGTASENRTRFRGSLIGVEFSIWLVIFDCFESRRLTMHSISNDSGMTK